MGSVARRIVENAHATGTNTNLAMSIELELSRALDLKLIIRGGPYSLARARASAIANGIQLQGHLASMTNRSQGARASQSHSTPVVTPPP